MNMFNLFVYQVPDPKPGSSVVLIGWGKVDTDGDPSSVLKQVESTVIEDCQKVL